MRIWVYDCWNSVMNYERNPLKHIPDLHARHMIMQILAWIWCVAFSLYLGSFVVFGISAVAHVALLGAIVITVGTFETAKRAPARARHAPRPRPARMRLPRSARGPAGACPASP